MRHILITLFVFSLFAVTSTHAQPLGIGSKVYTENVILGHMAAQSMQEAGFATVHNEQLGGTRILWSALLGGNIDVYPEYTGTLIEEILSTQTIRNREDLVSALSAFGVGITDNIGFNNTYALGMRRSQAQALGVTKISDLQNHPTLRYGFSNEFLERPDGWVGVSAEYGLAPDYVTGLEHALAYRGIANDDIDIVDL